MSLLEMSISAGLLIIGIVVIRSVALNKLPKNIFLILWGIVVLRLLIPFSIPVSNVNLNSISINGVIKDVITDTVMPESNQQSIEEEIMEPIIPIYQNQNYSSNAILPKEVEEIAQDSSTTAKLNINYIFIIWIAGMIIVICYFTITYLKSDRKLCFSLPIRDNRIINELLDKYKLIRHINIFESDRITTPIATGFIKPRIILPKYMNKSDKQLLQYVITHEYFHIKRMDILWKITMTIALCIHWFNPMVWVMYILANRDLEITCDEKVIRYLGLDLKAEYAYSLISMVEQRSKLTPIYSSFSKNAVEERIKSIMKYKKTSIIAIILSIIMILGTTTMFTINATIDDVPEDNDIDTIETFATNDDLYERIRELIKSSTNNDDIIDNSVHSVNQTTNNSVVYENGYILNYTWQNFIDSRYDKYESLEIELDRTYTILFSESAIKYMDDTEIIDIIKIIIPKLKENTQNYVIERFIINTIIDVKNHSIETLADKYYDENKIGEFSAIIAKLYDEAIQSRDDNYSDLYDELIERAYEDERTAMFSILANNINQEKINELIEKAYEDERTAMFSILVNVNQDIIDKLIERAYEDNRTAIFSILANRVNQDIIDELIERAYEDRNITYLSILINLSN